VKPPAVAATPESTRLRSMLWLYGVPTIFVLLWSSGFTFAKMGLEQASPFALLSLRYSLVLLILSPLYIWLRPPLPASRRAFGHVVVVGILIQVFFFGGTYVAITHGVSAGTVGLIFVFQPILVSVLAPKLTNERVNLGAWTGLCFGLVGAAAVIVARTSIQAPPLFGLAASFVGVAAMAAATLYEKRFGVQQHAVTSNLIQCGVGLVITAPLGLTLEGFHVVWSMKLAVALTYLVLCNSLVAITLLLVMVRRGEAARVSALFFLVPPTTAIVAWLLIGEAMPPLGWVGMLVAAIGVMLVRRAPASRERV